MTDARRLFDALATSTLAFWPWAAKDPFLEHELRDGAHTWRKSFVSRERVAPAVLIESLEDEEPTSPGVGLEPHQWKAGRTARSWRREIQQRAHLMREAIRCHQRQS